MSASSRSGFFALSKEFENDSLAVFTAAKDVSVVLHDDLEKSQRDLVRRDRIGAFRHSDSLSVGARIPTVADAGGVHNVSGGGAA